MITDEKIIEVCKTSDSMASAARELEMTFHSFSKRAKEIGCYKTNQFWNRGKILFDDSRLSKNKIEDIFCENSTKGKILNHREGLKNIIGSTCSICGIDSWLNNNLVLEIDHINGVNNDNRIENLRFLCPNCHSQTDTFRGRNIKRKLNKDGFFNYTKDEFIKIVTESYTIREVCISLSLTPKGGNYKTIRKNIIEFGISLKSKDYIKVEKSYNRKPKKDNKKRYKSDRKINKCSCGEKIHLYAKNCGKCSSVLQRKVERPSHEELVKEVNSFGYKATGRKYGVSDNSIRKWIKIYENNLNTVA